MLLVFLQSAVETIFGSSGFQEIIEFPHLLLRGGLGHHRIKSLFCDDTIRKEIIQDGVDVPCVPDELRTMLVHKVLL